MLHCLLEQMVTIGISKMHELMKQFKTKISISIDAHGKENEYIRCNQQVG